MDHAKALADIKRIAEFAYDEGLHEFGYDPVKVIESAFAHPAEAATRENGDLATALRCAEEVRYECQFASMPFPGAWARARLNKIIDFLRALSTHQKQGTESELVKRIRQYLTWEDCGPGEHSDKVGANAWELLEEAADALSRAPQLIPVDPVNPYNHEDRQRLHDAAHAPQPDTVTEEMVTAAMAAFFKPGMLDDGRTAEQDMRAALTAAIAARGKAG